MRRKCKLTLVYFFNITPGYSYLIPKIPMLVVQLLYSTATAAEDLNSSPLGLNVDSYRLSPFSLWILIIIPSPPTSNDANPPYTPEDPLKWALG